MSYLLAYYGDDFTGSTDVLEVLTLGGVPTVLFLAPPTAAQLTAFPSAQAVGIAGVSRSLTPGQMENELPPIFEALQRLNASYTHYKVCSTFDSAPDLGSIGKAVELARETFPQAVVPLVVGAPALKRYVAFGNLFAGVGAETYRLDRHPTMSKHPSTPMAEADLRRHLARQTELSTGLVDLPTLERGFETALERVAALKSEGHTVVLFDTVNDAHLLTLGKTITELAEQGNRFIVGSSGVEYALTAYLRGSGRLEGPPDWPAPGRAEPIVVMSGSASPATAAQLSEAERRGFKVIRIDVPRLLDEPKAEHARLKKEACAALAQGRSVALYSVRGPDDPVLAAAGGRDRATTAQRLGGAQGVLLRDLVETSGVRRVCVAGGDTCGYAARQLSLYALEFLAPLAPGSPLCRARSSERVFDGLELSLKAGQIGRPDYFLSVMNGHL